VQAEPVAAEQVTEEPASSGKRTCSAARAIDS
jgi:hypothetical protein